MLCSCWCQGWAEILIRCPTGNTSWMMRIQNQIGNNSGIEFPIRELAAIYLRNPDILDHPAQVEPEKPSPSLSPSYTPPFPPGGSANTSPEHRANTSNEDAGGTGGSNSSTQGEFCLNRG